MSILLDGSTDSGNVDNELLMAVHFDREGVDEILIEFECVLQYATKYISLSTLDYRAVWWRIFHSPDSASWVNVLNLIELLFSLPVSNGVVERVFSQMNVIKGKRRSLLANDTLELCM